jgi:hypothetical protein
MKSTAQVAAEQLRYLVFHRDHDKEVLANPALMGHLMQQVSNNGKCHNLWAEPTGRHVHPAGVHTAQLAFTVN